MVERSWVAVCTAWAVLVVMSQSEVMSTACHLHYRFIQLSVEVPPQAACWQRTAKDVS